MDKNVYNGWLKIYKREIGNRTYEILKNHDAVAVFLLNNEDEVLMVKQFRPAQMQETLEIPAGVLDIEGESFEQCAVRELREETGVTLEKDALEKIVSYRPMMGFSSSTMHMFMAKVEKDKLVMDNKVEDDEVTECLWVPLKQLGAYIEEGKVFDSKTLMAYFYYLSIKQ